MEHVRATREAGWRGVMYVSVKCKGRVMSSYASYCQAQAAECARRARLASSPDIAEDRRNLGLRWLKLAEKARAASRPLTQASKPSVAVPARA
jgi:hypothetical protein